LAAAYREFLIHFSNLEPVAVALQFCGEAGGYGNLAGLGTFAKDAGGPPAAVSGNVTGPDADTF